MTSEIVEPAVQTDRETLGEYADRMAMRAAWPSGLLAGLLVIILNIGRSPIPMMEDLRSFGIIGFISMLVAMPIVAGISFVLGVNAWNARVGPERQRQWGPPLIPVALAYTLVVGYSVVLMLTLTELAFQSLYLITLQSALLTGAIAGAIAFWIASAAMKTRTGNLLRITVVIIAAGMYLTAITIDDPLWWQISFSYLGKMESNAKMFFNWTLIFTGILLLVWLGYFMSDYRILVRHGIAAQNSDRWVRLGFAWLAVAVMLVGIFKSNYTPFSSLMHNWSAYSLAAVFGLLMFGGRWLVSGFPRGYFTASWTLVTLLIITLVSAALGRTNTVGLELVAFALGMAWLFLFVGNTDEIARHLEPDAFPD